MNKSEISPTDMQTLRESVRQGVRRVVHPYFNKIQRRSAVWEAGRVIQGNPKLNRGKTRY